MENMYPGIGRQYIWRRGVEADPDYVEKDNFTFYVTRPQDLLVGDRVASRPRRRRHRDAEGSYAARSRPVTDGPRQGDTIFRLTHRDPRGVFSAWRDRSLVDGTDAGAEKAFLDGAAQWLLLRGPDGQYYELGRTQPSRRENHRVYIWTQPEALAETSAAFVDHFALKAAGSTNFHAVATANLLEREEPGITIALLTPLDGRELAPRWSEDIFVEAGYSHYRLGAPDQARTIAASREAFPAGGDVAFVYFKDSYLELVQA